MNIVFCHGVGATMQEWENPQYSPYKGWKDWLQFMVEAQHDVIMQIPRFPHANLNLMKYAEWEQIMKRQHIDSDTILIGHSAGGGFILKYMSLRPGLHVRQIILVAPWIDTGGACPFGFYSDFEIDKNIVARTNCGIDLMVADNDMEEMGKSRDKIISDIPEIRTHWFNGYGHFVRPELPEIMQIIKF